ncbi:hypothetical protein BH09BAC2_BH09BAC2_13610 [soil metagenome]
MKYEVGDEILVLSSQEEGRVVEIINDKMVVIHVGGVSFPVYTDQIDFPYFKRFSQKKTFAPKKENKYIDQIKKEKSTAKYKVTEGVWVAFLPVFDKDVFDDDIVEYFKIFLINQTNDDLNFNYKLNYGGKPDFELKNQIYALSDFYLHDVPFEEMNDAPRFEFEFSLAKSEKVKAAYYESSLKIKAKQLFQKIEEIRLKNEPTFSYKLFQEYPDKLIDIAPDFNKLTGAGYRIYDAALSREHLEPARSVIDLHIEKLSDSWKHLSNFEILTLQLKAFEKYYDLAVAHRQPELIIIHGVGKGKLREEIHEILKTKREVKSFINQYNANYGYGATEIYFER